MINNDRENCGGMRGQQKTGKSISSELNSKRNSFVFLVKTCFECVLIAKQGIDYLKKVIVTIMNTKIK